MDLDSRPQTALQSFKDWSNYLLVTTVATAGWIASDRVEFSSAILKAWSLWFLGISIVCGIFTLALIPLVGQKIQDEKSIYDVKATFSLFRKKWGLHLTQTCRPQHIAFLLGILFFCLGTVGIPWIGATIGLAAVVVGWLSTPKGTNPTESDPQAEPKRHDR